MKVLFKWCTRILDAILFILLSVIVVLVLVQIGSRYLMHNPTTWTEEAVRYCFVWLVLLGSVKAMQLGRHLALEIITDKMSPKVGSIYQIFMSVIMIIFFVVITKAGLEILSTVQVQKSPTLQISMAIPMSSIPVGCGIMAIQQLMIIFNCIKSLRAGKEVSS